MPELDLSAELTKLLWRMPIVLEGGYLAGGALNRMISGEQGGDFDYYFKSKEAFEDAVLSCIENGMWCVDISNRVVTFRDCSEEYAQLVHFDYFPTADKIFESFDFTACMVAYDFDTKELIQHPRAFQDIASRSLVFNHKTAYPLASSLRVRKYQERGYKISRKDLLKVSVAVGMRGISSWEDLAEQLGGQYGYHIALNPDGKEFNLDNVIEAIDKVSDDLSSKNSGTLDLPPKVDNEGFAQEIIKRARGEKPCLTLS